ncbi:MAG: terminase family protein [Bacteroidota bacterium]|nr:terminase family protein [Bacteroidota bacterium]
MSEPKKQVDICVSDPQADILESTAQRNLFHSGVGSGKTHCGGLVAADFVLNNPEVRGFIGANTYSQLSKSTLNGMFKVWEENFGWKRDVTFVSNKQPPSHFKKFGPQLDDYDHVISFENGALLFTASLDNYKMIDGTEFAWAILDETKDTKEEAVREVITARMRQPGMWIDSRGVLCKNASPGSTGFNPLYIFTSPAKTDWLSEWFDIPEYFEEINASIFSETDYFRKRKGDKMVVISSTYHNKENLSEGYIERLIEDNKHNMQRVNMLIYGSPLAKTGGEYFPSFERLTHLKKLPIKWDFPVHLSFDFNRNPYMTCTMFQIWWEEERKTWVVYKFAEYCNESPRNYTEALCEDIVETWSTLMKNGIYYYGDYSGKNGRTNSTEDDYDVIMRVLKPFLGSSSDKVITNKGLAKRKDFMNKILAGGLPIEFIQNPELKNSVNEYEYLKEDPNGGKLKQLATNPNTGVQYQKYGHIADSDEYMFTSAFEQFFNN